MSATARLTGVAAVLCGAVLLTAAAGPGSDAGDAVTADQLASSVTTVDLDGAVHEIDLDGSVRELVVESVDGAEHVTTLASDLLFDFGSATVPPSAAAAVADSLADVPQGVTVSVGGHTDAVGGTADNQVLSEQRAQAVAALVAQARPDLVLDVHGYGESRPVADNGTAEHDDPVGRALNRRVELRYTP
jgi:outer membrane protein OmpA-like peptidoglycan-associated protein